MLGTDSNVWQWLLSTDTQIFVHVNTCHRNIFPIKLSKLESYRNLNYIKRSIIKEPDYSFMGSV